MRHILSIILFFLSCWTLHGSTSVDSTYYTLNQQLSEARQEKDFLKLATAYYELGLYEEEHFTKSDNSFEYFTNAKQYFELKNDITMSKTVDLAIANRYQKSGLYQEAIELYNDCIDYFEKHPQPNINLGRIYFDLSKVHEDRGDTEDQLRLLREANKLNQLAKDTTLQLDILLERIRSYERINELDSAYMTVDSILKTSVNINYPLGISRGWHEKARLEKLQSNYSQALRYAKESLSHIPYATYDYDRRDIYKLLANLYAYNNRHREALLYEQRYSQLHDSIIQREKVQSSNNLTMKYQLNEKNSDIRLLEIEKTYAERRNNQQRTMLYILSAGLLLLLALIYFIINFYKEKVQAESIIRKQDDEINKQKLKELEDHYQINNLQFMIEGQEIERERIARDLHDSLGGLLSAVKLQFDGVRNKNEKIGQLKEYQSANQMLDIAVDEVRTISQNLQPGSLKRMGLVPALQDLFNRFDGDTYPSIDFQTYDMPKEMDNMIALSIYRIIQELFYNALKHAKANEILIQINREDNELIIQFEDDGIGYDPNNLKRKGMGLENIKSRIKYLKGNINVDSCPGEGTSVILHLRYI